MGGGLLNKKIVIILLILTITITIGVSYAFWQITKTQTGDNVITSGCVDLTIDNQKNNIQLNNAYPTEDSEGEDLDPFTFTVTNHCNVKMDYEIGLEMLSDTNLESKYVKVLINEKGISGSSKLLNSYDNEDVTIIKDAKEGRILLKDKLEPTTEEENPSKKEYELRLWLDNEAGNETMNKTFKSKIVLSGVITTPKLSDDICNGNEESGACTIARLADEDITNLAYDDTEENNLRYIGNSPYNYIDIGDKDSAEKPILWRIIGVMNNMTAINDDGSESTGQSLVKIIRADSIGAYSWDSSASGVNSGYGVNEWSEADLMTTLNSGVYWNKGSGQCYSGSSNSQKACDFSSTGLTSSVKDKLVKVRWNTGTAGEVYSSSKITASYMYQGERSTHNGKEQCASSGGSNCNDPVERKTTWDGYIGLMYPSDYGYAVGGDERVSCLAKTMYNWYESTPDCKGNDWLYYGSSGSQWTITPVPGSLGAYTVFYVDSDGGVHSSNAYYAYAVRPTVYLDSNVRIQEKTDSDYGSKNNPFVLEGVS